MAGDKEIPQDTDLDDMEMDDFNFDDVDFDDMNQVDDSRSPVEKFSKSTLQGMRDKATDPTFVKNTITRALPTEYGKASKLIESGLDEGKELYNGVANEVRQTTRELKQAARRAKPAIDGVLPEWASKKLDGWLSDDEPSRSPEDEEVDAQAAQISGELSAIFKTSMEQNQEQAAEQRRHDTFKDMVDEKRANQQSNVMGNIRSLLARKVAYQDEVESHYQRKHLELQYKQLFTLTSISQTQQATAKDSIELLQAIAKNSGLPDYLKLRGMEQAEQIFKENLYGNIQEKVTGKLQPLMRVLSQRALENVKNIGEQVRGGFDMAAGAADMMAMGSDVGMDSTEMAGEMVGGGIFEQIGKFLGDRLKPILAENERIRQGSYFLDRTINDQDALLEEYAAAPTQRLGMLGRLEDFVKGGIRQLTPDRSRVGDYQKDDLRNPSFFSEQAHKSITEIIPGYLAKILAKIPNKGPIDEETRFDYERNEFASVSTMAKRLQDKVLGDDKVDHTATYIKELVDKIDVNGTLSTKANQDLQLALAQILQTNKRFTPELLVGNKHINKDSQGEINEVLKGALPKGKSNTMHYQRRYNEIAKQYRFARTYLDDDNQADFNFLYNTGNRDVLTASGLGQDNKDGPNQRSTNTKLVEAIQARSRKGQAGPSPEPVTTTPLTPVMPTPLGEKPPVSVAKAQVSEITHNGPMPVSVVNWPTHQMDDPDAPALDKDTTDRVFLEQQIQRVIESIDRQSVTGQSDEQVELLNQLLEAVSNIEVNQYNLDDLANQGLVKVSSWRKGLRKGAGNIFKGMKGLYNRGASVRDKVVKGAFGALGKVKDFGAGLIDRAKDIYVDGQVMMTKQGIRAGEYYDQVSGKVIKSFADIKGAVVDADGNIILTVDQVKNKLRDRFGKKIDVRGLATKLGNKVTDMLGRVIPTKLLNPFNVARKAFGVGRDFIDPVVDIYVAGERSPRLRAILLKQGHYADKDTGKTITRFADIKGEVIDRDGKVVLSFADIEKGLVDVKGQPFKRLTQRLKGVVDSVVGLGKKAFTKATSMVRQSVSLVGKMGKGAIKIAKEGLPTIKLEGLTSKSDDLLGNIYSLLVKWSGLKGDGRTDTAKGAMDTTGDSKVRGAKDSFNAAKQATNEQIDKLTKGVKGLTDNLKPEGGFVSAIKSAVKPDEGPRVGSWQWMQQQRDKAKDKIPGDIKDKAKQAKDKSSGWLAKLFPVIVGIGATLKSMFSGIGDMIKGIGGIRTALAAKGVADSLGGGVDVDMDKDGKRKTPSKAKPKGLLGKVGGWLGKAGGAALRAIPTVARLGVSAVAAAGTVVSAPVLLAGAAVGAAVYGGYKAYRYFKDKRSWPEKVRMVQYGAAQDDVQAMSHFAAVEDYVKSKVVYKGNVPSKIDLPEGYAPLYAIFDCDPNDEQHTIKVQQWFEQRFKHVYLSHVATTKAMFPATPLAKVDEVLDKTTAGTYFTNSQFKVPVTQSPYNRPTSPFADKIIYTGDTTVQQVIDAAIEAYGGNKQPTVNKAVARVVPKPKVPVNEPKATKPTSFKQAVTQGNIVNQTPVRKRAEIGPTFTREQLLPYNESQDPQQFNTYLTQVAKHFGVSAQTLQSLAHMGEQGEDSMLFGFDKQRYDDAFARYSATLGLQAKDKDSARAKAMVMALRVKRLQQQVGTKVNDIYLAHKLGEKAMSQLQQADKDTLLSQLIKDPRVRQQLGLEEGSKVTVGQYLSSMDTTAMQETRNAPRPITTQTRRSERNTAQVEDTPIETIRPVAPRRAPKAQVGPTTLSSPAMERELSSISGTLRESLSVQSNTLEAIITIAKAVTSQQGDSTNPSQTRSRMARLDELGPAPLSLRARDRN